MLAIDTLTRRFGDQTVLDGVSLEVAHGEVVCLVGPSGCGKSTILRLVAGLDRPDGGHISLNGAVISSTGWALEAHRRGLNMVFQDYALWPHMRVSQIVGYGLKHMVRHERDQKVAELLGLMQISHLADRMPSQISGGQQQRVAIARALATDPAILLLDEPLSNLDVQLRIDMRKEFSALFSAAGKTVLYVTHDPLEACSFADTLVVMNRGGIEQQGAPEALFAQPRSQWVATLAGYETRLHGQLLGYGEDGLARISVAGQTIRAAAPAAGLTDGTMLTLMIQPGSIALDPGGSSANRLDGVVTHALFEGRHWRIVVDIAGQALSLSNGFRVAVGETVPISFDPMSVVAFSA
jgi:putative spermidine/putrescine transport system ATP-binding protein